MSCAETADPVEMPFGLLTTSLVGVTMLCCCPSAVNIPMLCDNIQYLHCIDWLRIYSITAICLMNCLNIGVTSSVEVGIVVIIVVVLVCVNATVSVFTRCSKLHKVLFLALSVTKFVNHISREPLNGFAPNSHARHVWSLARTSLNVKGQCHQGQKTPCSLPSPPWQQRNGTHSLQMVILAACMQFVCSKTSSSSYYCIIMYEFDVVTSFLL